MITQKIDETSTGVSDLPFNGLIILLLLACYQKMQSGRSITVIE